ncbi:MAG: endonuclease I family protein [Pseudobdellovibrionaceae bacterium]
MRLGGLLKNSSVTFFIILGCLAVSAQSLTTDHNPYYGNQFYHAVEQQGAKDEALIRLIFSVISTKHSVRMASAMGEQGACLGRCVGSQSLSYQQARKELLGNISLKQDGNTYYVQDVYCAKKFYANDFRGAKKLGPGMIPDENLLNTEHTWPQSRFNRSIDRDTQKTDLHHLYPSDSQLNAIRGNFKFGNVPGAGEDLKCPISKRGRNSRNEIIFEPPKEHKGNAARAIFYFSIRYDLRVEEDEEKALREWIDEDPVDAEEMRRNNMINEIQGNRNPFIDHPELVHRINNF